MEIIPLIHFKKRKIQITQNGKETKTEDFIKEHTNIQKIYILDHDGIEKDKPNLCSFPKLSEKYETWIDTRPVTLGDVVDTVMAGANTITIRQNLWQTLDIERIREITENQIYAELDITTLKEENETLKADIVELKQFTKDCFDRLFATPSKEPVQEKETGIKKFRADFGGGSDPLANWLDKHN